MTDSGPISPHPTVPERAQQRRVDPLLAASVVLLLLVGGLWLAFTPSGVLGKMDAIGYAVCHRITVRSFLLPGGRQFPLCARCSGTFLGVLVGVLAPLLSGKRRAGGFPSLWMLAIMIGLSVLWAFDGANSFSRLIPAPWIPRLYNPTNFLRLVTGMGHGVTMGSLVLPVFNSTVWADATGEPTVARWYELLAMYAAGAALVAMLLSGWGIFLYPLAVLGAVGVLLILSMVSVVLAATLLRRENRAASFGDALPLLLLGLAGALVIVGGIDLMRYLAFGSWDGFILPEY